MYFAGQLDFDAVPLIQWNALPKPANFSMIDCGETGHWPQLEEPELFARAIQSWLKGKYDEKL
jgi:pimeloyl-ACP methyl ester carboxylesterase